MLNIYELLNNLEKIYIFFYYIYISHSKIKKYDIIQHLKYTLRWVLFLYIMCINMERLNILNIKILRTRTFYFLFSF